MARTRVSSGQIVGNLVFDGNTGITVPRGTLQIEIQVQIKVKYATIQI